MASLAAFDTLDGRRTAYGAGIPVDQTTFWL